MWQMLAVGVIAGGIATGIGGYTFIVKPNLIKLGEAQAALSDANARAERSIASGQAIARACEIADRATTADGQRSEALNRALQLQRERLNAPAGDDGDPLADLLRNGMREGSGRTPGTSN